jgi:hypothetical protein
VKIILAKSGNETLIWISRRFLKIKGLFSMWAVFPQVHLCLYCCSSMNTISKRVGRLAQRSRFGLIVGAKDALAPLHETVRWRRIALAPWFQTPIIAPVPAAMRRLLATLI